MTGKTHSLVGITFATGHALATQETNMAMYAVGASTAMFASLLPDIDHENARISRSSLLMSALSGIVCTVTTHRGITHSLVACVGSSVAWGMLMALLGQGVIPPISNALYSVIGVRLEVGAYLLLTTVYFFLGYLSHLVADSFNKQGVRYLQPFSDKRVSILPITTSSPFEWIFAGVVSVILCALAILYFGDFVQSHGLELPF